MFNFFGNENKKPESKEEPIKTASTSGDDEDPVEKIFSFFFGKPEAEPMGLKRFGPQRFPEQYPATVVDFSVAPVSTDDALLTKVRPVLKNTNFETRSLTLTYDANRNGWDPIKFHQALDKKGPALVVCTTASGLLCGGYNPKGWVGYGEARGSIAAFLFVENKSSADSRPFIKLRKVGGPGLAQLDYPESGPSFGADSLIIPLSKNNASSNPRMARSKLGSYYERMPDGTNSLFGKTEGASVQLKELKVFTGVYGKDEYVPFTDAEPFALY
jgi:TLD